MLDINALPDDVHRLKRLLLEHHAASLAKDLKLEEKNREIEHLKWQLAKLRRIRFGQTSEAFDGLGQMPLSFEELAAAVEQAQREVEALGKLESAPAIPGKPVRRKRFPDHFERVPEVIEPSECVCPDCGGSLGDLGTDEAEILEAKTVTFTVRRQVRPKKRCVKCSTIVQAPVPSRPIQKSFAGASLLALVLTWKYGFHVPLYRQCQIFSHAGLTLSRTTLTQWVAASSELLGPLVAALGKYVLSASNINADDTWIKVLAPGTGKTKTGHLWTYVRDGRPWGSTDPPAVWYQYSPSWHGKYPQRHLACFSGKLQVDAYAGFEPLFVPTAPGERARVEEISCMAHARRRFFDVHTMLKSPLAAEALDSIRKLYQIEHRIYGQPPEDRLAARQTQAVPILKALHAWMMEKATQVDPKSPLMDALNYSLNRWESLCRYTRDGRLSIDNNSAERSVRGVGIGRKNYMFFGSDNGGDRAAILYSLIETCKLNRIDPQRYMHYVLERIADHPINQVHELLPWNVAHLLKRHASVPESMAA